MSQSFLTTWEEEGRGGERPFPPFSLLYNKDCAITGRWKWWNGAGCVRLMFTRALLACVVCTVCTCTVCKCSVGWC